jgi:PAS domain S-box-containing protein
LKNELPSLIRQGAGGLAPMADMLDSLPCAVYATDAEGIVTYFNRAAAAMAGREPVVGKDKWCVSWRLYDVAGNPLQLDDCPMAVALRERRPVRGVEILVERPDGSRMPVMPAPTPIFDSRGELAGAVNVLTEIADLKRAEDSLGQRRDEQTALYQFTDRLYRSASTEEIYEAALEAICAALKCDRASILLFDQEGVMRFVAWRDLSEVYRAAVDGHSPWIAGQRNPEPIFVEDVAKDPELAPLLPIAQAENVVALAFIPIVDHGATIGKFMAYYRAAHAFTGEESAAAVVLARQLGFGLERIRSDDMRRREETVRSRLASIVESSQDAIISKDLSAKIMSWNAGAERIFGYTADEAIDQSILMLIPPDRVAEESEILGRIQRGERVEHYETVRVRKDGTFVDLSLTVSPIRDATGKVIGASKIARDITDRRRADEHRKLLVNELNHRVKNTLATVQSIAMQTLRTTERSIDARVLFEARLAALSRAHDVLTNESWSGASLGEIVRRTLAPFQSPEHRLKIEGPAARLSPKQALAIAMAIHELATNAAKYGALSNRDGDVAVAWQVDASKFPACIQLTWTEKNGPPVAELKRKGFGSRMIQLHLAAELGGDATLDFATSGVVCKIATPLGWGLNDAADAFVRTAS